MPDTIQAVFRPENLVSVTTGAVQSLSWSKGKTALLCSGVGHAGSFRSLVERMGIRILGEVAYADHHTYTRQDVERLRTRAVELQAELVVTTEKDACKMASLLHPTDAWWAVRLTTQVIEGEDRLRRLVIGMGVKGGRLKVWSLKRGSEACEERNHQKDSRAWAQLAGRCGDVRACTPWIAEVVS